MNKKADNSRSLKGHLIALDPKARSRSSEGPAFIYRPEGAPVYYGFQVMEDVIVEGFTFGKITDLEAEPADYGDAFVIAPDNSRCGLIWEVGPEKYFREVLAPTSDRWGVWGVGFQLPMTTRENVRSNLASILPELKQRWKDWLGNK